MADPSHGMRLLILFVAALGRQIEPVVDAHHGLQSTSVGGIRMKDVAVGILEKDAGAGRFFSGEKLDRKSTRLNSSHGYISYAVFCLKKKKTTQLHNERNVTYANRP